MNEAIERRQISQSQPQGGRPGSGSALIRSLPIELRYLIVDAVDSRHDIGNLHLAFRWQLPDVYWRGRFPKNVVFEYERLMCQSLDWQHLCLGAPGLFETSHGFRKSERLMRLLNAT